MGKKRKAGGRYSQPKNAAPAEQRASDSKLQVNTYEDLADSEDEFHIDRDKILLEEGPAQKRQRRIRENGRLRILMLKAGIWRCLAANT